MISSIVAPSYQQEEKDECPGVRSFLKIGSLQKFVKCEGPIENFSSELFSAQEIHKIAVLDLRMLNLDRNECNILVCAEDQDAPIDDLLSLDPSQQLPVKRRLVPIDHGLSIPDTLAIQSFDLVWLGFRQAEEPFSAETLDYISKIDVMADIKLLEDNFKFRPQCLRNMRIASTLLKKGAAAGMTLAQICQILCRPDHDEDEDSLLEHMVRRARMCANMMAQIQSNNHRRILPLDIREERRNSSNELDFSDLAAEPQQQRAAPRTRINSNNDQDCAAP